MADGTPDRRAESGRPGGAASEDRADPRPLDPFASLPTLDPATLPSVFGDAEDRARTQAALDPAATRRRRTNVERHRFLDFQKRAAAARTLDALPRQGEAVHIVLSGSCDLSDLLARIVEMAAAPVEALSIATLGFGDRFLETVLPLLDNGNVRRLRMVASHYFKSADAGLWGRAHKALTDRGQELFVARCHAKVQAYRFAGGGTLTLLSSANLRSCKSTEAVVLMSDREAHDFWAGVIEDLTREAARCSR